MSGLTGLVDILLAERLSQRADLPRLPTAAVVSGPQPTFSGGELANDVRLASDASVDRQAGPGASPAAARAEEPADQPVAVLSVAGRAISRVLMDLRVEAGPTQGAAPLASQRPSYASVPLAAALADAVATSGLFYESHLAAFAAGQLPRALLDREPQSRWGRAGRERTNAPVETIGQPPGEDAAAGSLGSGGVQQRAVGLVHQQLELLANGVFRWSGEAWPGVPMHWEVSAEDPGRQRQPAPAAAAPAAWTTTLTLDLPRLGAVAVRVRLDGTSVSASVQAAEGAIAPLRGGALDLRQRLERAGLQLPQLAIAGRGEAS